MPDDARVHLSFAPLGDRALLVEVGEALDPVVTARVRTVAARITARALRGVTDVVPAFCSVALHYDPGALRDRSGEKTPYDALVEQLQELLAEVADAEPVEGRLFEIPVVYGGAFGEDLAPLAQARGLAPEQVAEIHCAQTYSVYMLGFAPGFGYLGPVDERLRQPRREMPRTRVVAGSVALANAFTGIYPMELPGGWHVIGRTPWRLFDVERNPPALLAAGDRVRFVPITPAEFDVAAARQPWR
ncbi:MAG TPA: 5-oxoprolinase subunit PxpB [Burkholderiales bacterium]|jgi:inhibitor of KinA|nr:5-oxoprolinase subunit PxpB [Burkholderiales bacterium]